MAKQAMLPSDFAGTVCCSKDFAVRPELHSNSDILALCGLEQVGSLLQSQFCSCVNMGISLLYVRVHVYTYVHVCACVMINREKNSGCSIWHMVSAP